MARKTETSHYKIINIAVVGLSGTEKEKGCLGVGKSCLCNRFIRPSEDDYNPDHISVLSQTDFSGRIINNEHWLYWGETTKTSDEGYELAFSVIEQTEFIDDACFQPFKSGKTEPYYKRCAATRLSSAEKMMYICKNQLGIEKEYEQRYLNDGRFSIDGYVCVFDVSQVQGRSIERQIELTALILNCLMKTKKPIVLATTKHDECYDFYLKEAERLVNRKEYKGSIVLVETSAHENVNVDLAFVCCAQMIDRTKGKSKNVSFIESSRNRKDALDNANDAYLSLIQTQITDYRTLWNNTYKKLSQSQDFMNYCELFGQDSAHMTFKRHIKKLKEDYLCRKMQMYLRILPEVLTELMPDLDTIGEPTEWTTIKDRIRSHPDFDQYFVDNPDQTWQEVSDFDDGSETRIPFDLLDTPEAEQVFVEHRMSLESGERQKELRHQFKQLLQETGFVTPGKSLTEVRILFMGRECYESLSERDIIEIYEEHQKDITDLSKMNFQELLLEHSSLFYHFASLGPGSVITQDDIQKITETLEDDHRYKALDRLDQDRTLMLLRHLGFIHGPIREHCPVFPNCMDVLIEKYNACKARRPSTDTRNSHWFSESNNNHINLILLGSGGLSDELCTEIKQINETFEMDTTRFTLDFRIIGGDVDLPQNAFRTVDFSPKGCFCVYSNHQTLEYVRQSLEKTLLSDLEQEDGLPFHGLPIVILFAANSNINEKDLIFLREEGQNRAKSLQCPFIDVTNFNSHSSDGRFDTQCLSQALRALIESIQRRADLMQIYQSVLPEQALNPDIRILVCMLCGDPFNIEHIMSPFLNQNLYYVTSSHSITIEIIIGETKRFVELVCTSYHGAHAYRDELLHGFLLIYSCGRKASFATMSAFTDNIPNTPLQIVAFSDTSNSNIYYSNHDLDLQLLSEGTNMADKLEAHFISSAPNQQKSSYFIPFLKEVFERKPQIEKAFEMDDSDYSIDRPIVPTVPTRQESYHIRSGSADSDGIYEHLGDKSNDNGGELISSSGFVDGQHLSPSDDSEVYASVYNQENGEHLVKPSQIKNRRSLQADLYRQSFPSTESLDRPLSNRRSDHSVNPPLPPRRDLSYAPPPYTRAMSPPPSYLSHFSPRHPLQHKPLKPSSDELKATPHSSTLYSTDRRRMPPYSDIKSFTPFQYHFHIKKSNSLKASSLGNTVSGIRLSPHSSRLPEDADNASDDASDEDDDTVSSGLSGYGAYPPPPEPAPPDYPYTSRLKKTPSLPTSGHLQTQHTFNEGWMERDNRVYERGSEEWLDNDVYHAYHSSHHKLPPPIKPKPGKLNLKQFDNITDAIGRLTVGPRQGSAMPKVGLLNAPLAASDLLDMPVDYTKDAIYGRNSHDYYSGLQNTITDSKHRVRLNRRNKDSLEKVGSDSDSDWSSLERRERELYNRANRKPTPHKKVRKKRGIPVAPPRLPSFESTSNHFSNKSAKNVSDGPTLGANSPVDAFETSAKHKNESSLSCIQGVEEEDYNPRDATMAQLGKVLKSKSATAITENIEKSALKKEKDRKKTREDEKLEKRRIKEEERLKRLNEKKKKKQKNNSTSNEPTIEDFIQSEDNAVPLFVEKCIQFIEEEGLDSEGIYRVPGNRAHVDLLFQKFEEDPNVSIRELDIPVNAVATALKDFFSKRLPPLIPTAMMDELTDLSSYNDKSSRLSSFREFLKSLPSVNFEVIKFVFKHFVKVADNCRLNSMDTKNLAICWWPTLLPIEFSDMLVFEQMRPHLEDFVQTLIDEFQFLFGNEDVLLIV
ncbi:rho GTPase-activating protein 190-like isoform X2 [Oppia nitens]|uniref:rho GTPase-activating protein 190-like isoform X2 n=1 Tax=Oppia nitens TaxID=1686743 RepID=UPI0023DC1AE0|nr:rho GTPase-activating protein 190-like isoform X2 [Oppia nitens]